MFKKSKLLSAAIFSAASLLAFNGQADTMGTPKISAMSILNGLENPWDMAFTKNGDMFFTEKCKGFSVKTKRTNRGWQHVATSVGLRVTCSSQMIEKTCELDKDWTNYLAVVNSCEFVYNVKKGREER